MKTQSQPPAAGEAAHRFQKFRIVPFLDERKRPINALWHDPELTGGYPLAYFNREAVGDKKAQSVADLLNSHAALVEALKDAQQALAHAIYRLKDDGQFSTSIALKGAEEKARAALESAKEGTT